MDDERLLERACRGDADAVSRLFARYQTSIYRYAVHMCGRDSGDDIVQETFLTIMRRPGQYDSARGPVIGYLLGIARHLAEGVTATGRRSTTTIPAGQIGNDRPIEITDERSESPDLKVLVYSRFSDPRTGVVEFKLTNINRAQPPADLFGVPADYTILEPGAGGVRGGRVGGPGGRGPQ